MTVCTNPDHPFSYPPREQMWRDIRRAEAQLERERAGYIGGIAYALRLLDSPPLRPDAAPINLLAARGVLEAMLDGHADNYVSMAAREMQMRQKRATASAGGAEEGS